MVHNILFIFSLSLVARLARALRVGFHVHGREIILHCIVSKIIGHSTKFKEIPEIHN